MTEKPSSPPYAPFSGLETPCPKDRGRVGAEHHPGGTVYIETGTLASAQVQSGCSGSVRSADITGLSRRPTLLADL